MSSRWNCHPNRCNQPSAVARESNKCTCLIQFDIGVARQRQPGAKHSRPVIRHVALQVELL